MYETSYEKYGTQKITVTITTPYPPRVYNVNRRTEIPTHPQNNSSVDYMFTMEKGVPRWYANEHVIPADALAEYFIDQIPGFNKEATDKARTRETQAALAAYRASRAGRRPSGEEMFEMRAAFGRGTKVVNIITGQTTRL